MTAVLRALRRRRVGVGETATTDVWWAVWIDPALEVAGRKACASPDQADAWIVWLAEHGHTDAWVEQELAVF